jgi:hypothetical protein
MKEAVRESPIAGLGAAGGAVAGEVDLVQAAAACGHTAVIEFLVKEMGIPLYAGHRDVYTALHAACEGGHVEAAGLFLDLGAAPAVRTIRLWGRLREHRACLTPLGLAVVEGSFACARLLLERGLRDGGGEGLVALAVVGGHWDVLRAVLKDSSGEQADVGCSIAAGLGDLDMVSFLMGKGARCKWSGRVERVLRSVSGPCLFAGLRKVVGAGLASRGFAEGCLAVIGSMPVARWHEERHLVDGLCALGVRARKIWRLGEEIDGPRLEVVRALCGGDLSLADLDLYKIVRVELIPQLIEEGVEMRWERYSTGEKYLPLLTRCYLGREVADAVIKALEAARVDVSRHHYCDGPVECRCRRERGWWFRDFFQRVGAVPCQRRGRGA